MRVNPSKLETLKLQRIWANPIKLKGLEIIN